MAKKAEVFIQPPNLSSPLPPPIPCISPLSEINFKIIKGSHTNNNNKRNLMHMSFVCSDDIETPITYDLEESMKPIAPPEAKPTVVSPNSYSHSAVTIQILKYLKQQGFTSARRAFKTESGSETISLDKEPLRKSEFIEILRRRIQQLDPPKREEPEENIWVELGRLSSKGLSFDPQTKELRGGSINRLIERLTDNEKYNKEFMKAFLMTHKSFTNSRTLFRKLCERYRVPSNERVTKAYVKEWEESRTLIKLRVCNVLKNWIEYHFSDFTKDMIENLFIFIDEVAASSGESAANQLKQSLTAKINGASSNILKTPPIRKDPKTGSSLKDMDPKDVARQLTLIEYQLYSQIEHDELLDAKWSVAKVRHLSPNLNTFVERFNHVSYWISSIILKQASLQDRGKTLINLIRVEDYLRQLRNYNTLMSINSALNIGSINKLKETWSFVSPELMQVHKEVTALFSNVAEYKDKIQHVSLPMIPFIGPFLTDLVFIEDGNPNEIEGLTNITKRILAYRTISLVLRGQAVAYELEKMPRMYTYLYLLSDELSESAIEKLSNQRIEEEQRIAREAGL